MSLICRRDPAKQYVPKGPRKVIGQKSINWSKEWYEYDKYSPSLGSKIWHGVCGICTKVFKYQTIMPQITGPPIRFHKSRVFHRYQKHKLLTHWKELGLADFKEAETRWQELFSGFSESEKHELKLDEEDGVEDEKNDDK